ncbi:hypothetical protein AeRB84_006241 [Aphanomyces euteiches]|nr:hypothetical protein AeRB84_006241 [Aphanomyces euteiches]
MSNERPFLEEDDTLLDDATPHEPLLSSHARNNDEKAFGKKTTSRWTWKRTAFIGIGVVGIVAVVLALCIRPIAIRAIQATHMEIQRMELQDPSDTSVRLMTQLMIKSDSIFGVTMKPANLTIRYGNASVGAFGTPSMDISHGSIVHTIANASLTVTNMTAWTAFASEMIQSTNMTWTLEGMIDIQLHLFGISLTQLPLQKTMKLLGMQGLHSLIITKMDLSASTKTQVLAAINTCLYNPSSAAMKPVGVLCLDVFFPDPKTLKPALVAHLTTSANTSLPITQLDPSAPECTSYGKVGMNYLALSGEIVSTVASATSALISQYLGDTAAHVQVAACWPGASSIPLYNGALRHLHLNSTLPPNPVPLINKLSFDTMHLAPVDDSTIAVDMRVVVTAKSPLGDGSPLTLSAMNMSIDLQSDKVSSQYRIFVVIVDFKVALGALTTSSVNVTGIVTSESNLTLDCKATLKLRAGGQPFGGFVHSLVQASQKTMDVVGGFNVVANGALGDLNLRGVPVKISSQLIGMNGLSNVSIVDFALPGQETPEGHQVIKATTNIWNPSVIAMAVGKVDLKMRVDGEALGSVLANITLEPSSTNRVDLTGYLNPQVNPTTHALSPAVNAFFSRYISNTNSSLGIDIAQVDSPIPWIQAGLKGISLTTIFPGVKVQLVSSLEMPQMHMHFDATSMHMHARMLAGVQMPPALATLPINITRLKLQSRLFMASTELCLLSIPELAVEYTPKSTAGTGVVKMESDIAMTQIQTTSMASFIVQLMFSAASVPLQIRSREHEGVSPTVESPLGRMALTNIPITTPLVLDGMDGFKRGGVNITAVDIVSGTADTLKLSMALHMSNPSQVTTVLDTLAVQVLINNSVLGTAVMDNVTLVCCNQTSNMVGLFSFKPASAAVGQTFLSQFVSGASPQQVDIQGTVDSSPNPYLQMALSKLRLQSSVPTLAGLFPETPTLVALSKMYRPSVWDLFTVATALQVRNPFSHSIRVTAANLLLYPCENQNKDASGHLVCTKYYASPLARFHPDEFEPMLIPGKTPEGCFTCCEGRDCGKHMKLCPGAIEGKCMKAKVEMTMWSLEVIRTLYATMTTGLLMHVEGNLTAMVDSFPMELAYTQDALLVQMA